MFVSENARARHFTCVFQSFDFPGVLPFETQICLSELMYSVCWKWNLFWVSNFFCRTMLCIENPIICKSDRKGNGFSEIFWQINERAIRSIERWLRGHCEWQWEREWRDISLGRLGRKNLVSVPFPSFLPSLSVLHHNYFTYSAIGNLPKLYQNSIKLTGHFH